MQFITQWGFHENVMRSDWGDCAICRAGDDISKKTAVYAHNDDMQWVKLTRRKQQSSYRMAGKIKCIYVWVKYSAPDKMSEFIGTPMIADRAHPVTGVWQCHADTFDMMWHNSRRLLLVFCSLRTIARVSVCAVAVLLLLLLLLKMKRLEWHYARTLQGHFTQSICVDMEVWTDRWV